MTVNREKIEVNALQQGMFVSDLDRPWHETPFPLQGFYIQQDDDVKALSEFCRHVYIDIKRQKLKHHYGAHATHKPTSADNRKDDTINNANILKLPPLVIKEPQHYLEISSIKKEVSKASKLHRHVYEAIDQVFSSIDAGGTVTIQETENVASGMVDSVIRNPDALVWLAKMNDGDGYSYRHSVNASIWALVFGRHLGLQKSLLKSLAVGVLLAHIGKTKLDLSHLDGDERLENQALEQSESYVGLSVGILESIEDLPNGVLSVVKYHRERHNGSGFPGSVTGDRIPLLAKIAGIVDYYQRLIAPRERRQGMSPLEAVSRLYELRDIAFQADIVERFIEAVGVYPTGTLVELSSAEVGIVTAHNQDRRLFPKVMVVLDDQKQPLKTGRVLDLMGWNEKPPEGKVIFIKDSLPKGAYGIDETEYLLTGAKSRWSWKHLKGSLAAS